MYNINTHKHNKLIQVIHTHRRQHAHSKSNKSTNNSYAYCMHKHPVHLYNYITAVLQKGLLNMINSVFVGPAKENRWVLNLNLKMWMS